MELYGFVGNPGHDLVLYLGRLLRQLGKSVVILDCSEEGEVLECVPKLEEDPIHYQGMDITGCADTVLAQTEAWDVGILLLSYWSADPRGREAVKKLPEVKELYLLTDFKKRNVLEARDVLKREKISMVILRDSLCGKINKNYLVKNYFAGCGQPQKIYELPLEEGDYEQSIRLVYEPLQSLRGLSGEWKRLLWLLAEHMTGLSRKQIRKAYGKRERRGRN